MLSKQQTDFLDSIINIAADGASYIPGEAGEIEAYIVKGLSDKIKAQPEGYKATPLDFLNDGLEFSDKAAVLFGNIKVQALVRDVKKTVIDGEEGNYFGIIGDLITDWKDIKALKAS